MEFSRQVFCGVCHQLVTPLTNTYRGLSEQECLHQLAVLLRDEASDWYLMRYLTFFHGNANCREKFFNQQASSTTAPDASSVSRSMEKCSICGQLRDVKGMAKHLKAHEPYSGNTDTGTRKAIVHSSFGLQPQGQTGRAQTTARAVYTSSQQNIPEQN